MIKKQLYLIFFATTFTFFNCFAQDSLKVKEKELVSFNSPYEFNPLAPATAAFYSAVLPGLGQGYNKKYWKIPIVYAALGTSLYFYVWNNDKYMVAREAYRLRLNGKPDDYDGENGNSYLSDDALVNAQKSYKKDRDLSLLITIGLYVLQIIEASVNAHLLQHNVDDNLSFRPKMIKNKVTNKSIVGASINYSF